MESDALLKLTDFGFAKGGEKQKKENHYHVFSSPGDNRDKPLTTPW